MSESGRLRSALEAVLPWVGVYDDHMGGDDFERREAAELFATRVLAGDEYISLESARAEVCSARTRRARGPRFVIGHGPS